MSFVVNVLEDNLESILNSDLPVIVKFWSPSCGACKMVAPAFNELAEQCLSRAWFANAQAEQTPSTMKEYGIDKLPTLILFKQGKEIERLVGAPPYQKLIEFTYKAFE